MRWNDDRMEDAVKGVPSFRSYGSALREAVGKLSQSVLGRCWDERYRTPGAYTGKKLCPIQHEKAGSESVAAAEPS